MSNNQQRNINFLAFIKTNMKPFLTDVILRKNI